MESRTLSSRVRQRRSNEKKKVLLILFLFALALGLWLLLRDQPFASQLVGLGIPAVMFRLAACRNLF